MILIIQGGIAIQFKSFLTTTSFCVVAYAQENQDKKKSSISTLLCSNII
jgi:hypothetical protein